MVFTGSLQQPMGRSMGKGKAPGTRACLLAGLAHGDSPPWPLTPVHQPPPLCVRPGLVGAGVPEDTQLGTDP